MIKDLKSLHSMLQGLNFNVPGYDDFAKALSSPDGEQAFFKAAKEAGVDLPKDIASPDASEHIASAIPTAPTNDTPAGDAEPMAVPEVAHTPDNDALQQLKGKYQEAADTLSQQANDDEERKRAQDEWLESLPYDSDAGLHYIVDEQGVRSYVQGFTPDGRVAFTVGNSRATPYAIGDEEERGVYNPGTGDFRRAQWYHNTFSDDAFGNEDYDYDGFSLKLNTSPLTEAMARVKRASFDPIYMDKSPKVYNQWLMQHAGDTDEQLIETYRKANAIDNFGDPEETTAQYSAITALEDIALNRQQGRTDPRTFLGRSELINESLMRPNPNEGATASYYRKVISGEMSGGDLEDIALEKTRDLLRDFKFYDDSTINTLLSHYSYNADGRPIGIVEYVANEMRLHPLTQALALFRDLRGGKTQNIANQEIAQLVFDSSANAVADWLKEKTNDISAWDRLLASAASSSAVVEFFHSFGGGAKYGKYKAIAALNSMYGRGFGSQIAKYGGSIAGLGADILATTPFMGIFGSAAGGATARLMATSASRSMTGVSRAAFIERYTAELTRSYLARAAAGGASFAAMNLAATGLRHAAWADIGWADYGKAIVEGVALGALILPAAGHLGKMATKESGRVAQTVAAFIAEDAAFITWDAASHYMATGQLTSSDLIDMSVGSTVTILGLKLAHLATSGAPKPENITRDELAALRERGYSDVADYIENPAKYIKSHKDAFTGESASEDSPFAKQAQTLIDKAGTNGELTVAQACKVLTAVTGKPCIAQKPTRHETTVTGEGKGKRWHIESYDNYGRVIKRMTFKSEKSADNAVKMLESVEAYTNLAEAAAGYAGAREAQINSTAAKRMATRMMSDRINALLKGSRVEPNENGDYSYIHDENADTVTIFANDGTRITIDRDMNVVTADGQRIPLGESSYDIAGRYLLAKTKESYEKSGVKLDEQDALTDEERQLIKDFESECEAVRKDAAPDADAVVKEVSEMQGVDLAGLLKNTPETFTEKERKAIAALESRLRDGTPSTLYIAAATINGKRVVMRKKPTMSDDGTLAYPDEMVIYTDEEGNAGACTAKELSDIADIGIFDESNADFVTPDDLALRVRDLATAAFDNADKLAEKREQSQRREDAKQNAEPTIEEPSPAPEPTAPEPQQPKPAPEPTMQEPAPAPEQATMQDDREPLILDEEQLENLDPDIKSELLGHPYEGPADDFRIATAYKQSLKYSRGEMDERPDNFDIYAEAFGFKEPSRDAMGGDAAAQEPSVPTATGKPLPQQRNEYAIEDTFNEIAQKRDINTARQFLKANEDRLAAQAEELRQQQQQAIESGDSDAYNKLQPQIEELERQMGELERIRKATDEQFNEWQQRQEPEQPVSAPDGQEQNPGDATDDGAQSDGDGMRHLGIAPEDRQEWDAAAREAGQVDVVNRLDSAAKELGLSLQFYDGEPGENGYISGKSIFVNRNASAKEKITFVLGHEMTHGIDDIAAESGDTTVYDDFHEAAVEWQRMQDGDEAYEQRVNKVLNLYRAKYEREVYDKLISQGIDDDIARRVAREKAEAEVSRAMAEREVVADVAGRVLTDPDKAEELFRNIRDISTARRWLGYIRDFYNKMLSYITGDEERRRWITLRNRFNDLYTQSVETELRMSSSENNQVEDSDISKKNDNFADRNTGILTIHEDKYTDDFRRVQAESQRLSDERVRQYHRGKEGGRRFSSEERRALGAVYGRLLARGVRGGTANWVNLIGKNNTFRFAQVNGQLFHDIFEINRRYLKNGELVDLHDNYDDAKCFISEDGLCGFAIEPNGNLVSVFSLNPSDRGGFLHSIRDFVRQQGATHLDAFDCKNQPLQEIYEKTLGFKTASVMDYDMELDHDDIASNHGNPDVVFMVANDGDVEVRHFGKDDYDAAAAYQQTQIPRISDGRSNSTGMTDIRYSLSDRTEAAEQNVQRARQQRSNAMQRATDLRRAASVQRQYDRTTVDEIKKLATGTLEDEDLDSLTRGEVKRILAALNNANGKNDVHKQAMNIADVLISKSLREARGDWEKSLQVSKKLNAQGVREQGPLDERASNVLKVVNENIGKDADTLRNNLADASTRMGDEDAAVAQRAEDDFIANLIAQRYQERIRPAEDNVEEISKEITQTRKELADINAKIRQEEERGDDKDASVIAALKAEAKPIRDKIAALKEELVYSKEQLSDNYLELTDMVNAERTAGRNRAKEWLEQQAAHTREVLHNANSDTAGADSSTFKEPKDARKANRVTLFNHIAAPLRSFEQFMRYFGRLHPHGEGYLYRRFITGDGGTVACGDREWRELHDTHQMLDDKAQEIFGVKRWSDIFKLYGQNGMEGYELTFNDGKTKKTTILSQGQMAYLYAVAKQVDGRPKLHGMGITDDTMSDIEAKLNPKIKQLVDWLQENFLPKKRELYNQTHLNLYGVSMAENENYFPILINTDYAATDTELGGFSTPSVTFTPGAVKERKANNRPVMLKDAFDVTLRHISEMTDFWAWGEFRRDLKALLNYKTFERKAKNMGSAVFGHGENFWKNFTSTAEIAAGVYRTENGSQLANAFGKNATTAKIAARIFTAAKQLSSYPAFIADANLGDFLWNLPANIPQAIASWKWAMDKLPGFSKRWQSRGAGNEFLKDIEDPKKWVDTLRRYAITPNAFVDAVTVACGAHAVYSTKYKRYRKDGFSHEVANRKALRDASVSYNASQQSSDQAFTAKIQKDRDLGSVSVTVFRNGPQGYSRRFFDAVHNLTKYADSDFRTNSVEYLKKQAVREGLSEEQAERVANRIYRRGAVRSLATIGTFGFVTAAAWNLVSHGYYYVFGNDDEQKKQGITRDLKHALLGGFEGLAYGNVVSNIIDNIMAGDKVSEDAFTTLPISSDMERLIRSWNNKDKYKAVWQTISLATQLFAGVDPQVLTDMIVAVDDAAYGDQDTSQKALLLVARLINTPQSQLDMTYVDELNMSGAEAAKLSPEDVAKRYARYKARRENPLLYALSQEVNDEAEQKYIKRLQGYAQLRAVTMSTEELEQAVADAKDLFELGIYKSELNKRYDERGEQFSSSREKQQMSDVEKLEKEKAAIARKKYVTSPTDELLARYEQTGDKALANELQQRLAEMPEEELIETYRNSDKLGIKKNVAKVVFKKAGLDNTWPDRADKEYNKIYISNRTYEDVVQDAALSKAIKDAEPGRKKYLTRMRELMNRYKKSLGAADTNTLMQSIRELRATALNAK